MGWILRRAAMVHMTLDKARARRLLPWLEMLATYEKTIHTGTFWQRVTSPSEGGMAAAWTTYGVPLDEDVAQNIEIAIAVHGVACLARALGPTAQADALPRLLAAAQNSVGDPSRFTQTEWQGGGMGPAKFQGVGKKGQAPYPAITQSWGGSNPVNFPDTLAIAYAGTGNKQWLDLERNLGAPTAPTVSYAAMAAATAPDGWNETLIAALESA
jgi:hypothetical protein